MKVLILSTYETRGGAAIAACRLLHALQKYGKGVDGSAHVDATMLCRRNLSWWKGSPQSWTSIIERAMIWACNGFSRHDLWTTDLMLLGQDITKTKEYREADVIHLHWVQQGFISLSAVEHFVRDGKRVVWTMHDAWNAMGAYHLALNRQDTWIERWCMRRKAALYKRCNIQFVTCSQWLRGEALTSTLMQGQSVEAIPNPIDMDIFHPQPDVQRQSSPRVLFVAQDVNNPYKGMAYLDEAAKILDAQHPLPSGKRWSDAIVALGRDIPYISDTHEMAKLYASVDAFVLPSLSENLPNTIMEAMACGTPCVGFNVGGIPEMIDHKQNGYVARYKDAADLAAGIRYVIDNHDALSRDCVLKIERCYSERAVAERTIALYNNHPRN